MFLPRMLSINRAQKAFKSEKYFEMNFKFGFQFIIQYTWVFTTDT